MAQPNILVIATTFCCFTIELICFVVFNIETVYWLGYIFNTIALYMSIGLFVKGGCVQGVWYNEVYESVQDDEEM